MKRKLKHLKSLKLPMAFHQKLWTHWSKQIFLMQNVKTVTCGLETISVLGPKIWSILPNELKLTGPANQILCKKTFICVMLHDYQQKHFVLCYMIINKNIYLCYVIWLPTKKHLFVLKCYMITSKKIYLC